MSEVFLIADTHFGHKGIINFDATKPFRPFETIEEHDEELVRRWNNTVSKRDVVYHLGDFCFGKRNLHIAGRLNGIKKLVMGNHDCYATQDYLEYFDKVYGAVEYKHNILFTHIPIHESQLNRYMMNVHGHLHTLNVEDWRYFNVSAEQIDLTPVPFDIVLDRWAENN